MQALAAAITAMDRIIAPEPEKGNKQTKRDQKKVEALLELAGLKGIKDPIVLADLADSPLGYVSAASEWRLQLLTHLRNRKSRSINPTPGIGLTRRPSTTGSGRSDTPTRLL